MFKKITLVVLIIQFLLIPAFLFAGSIDASKNKTWEDIVGLTEIHNLDLKIAKEGISIAKKQKCIVKSGQHPKLSTGVSLGKSDNGISNSYLDTERLSLNVSYLLYDGNKTYYNLLAEEEAVNDAINNYLITESNIRLELREKFCALLKSQELLKLTDTIKQRRKQQLELVELRHKAGLEHRGSLLTAKANYEKAVFEENQARRELLINQKQLSTIIGIDTSKTFKVQAELTPNIKPIPMPDFKNIVENVPLFKTVVFRKNQAKYNMKATKSNYLPRLFATAGTGKDLMSLNQNSPLYDNWSLGINLSYDILDGGKRDNELQKAKLQYAQKEWDLKKSLNDILLTMECVWAGYISALDEEQVLKSFAYASKERSTIAEAQYSSGLISFDNWTIIEDALINSQKKYLTARINTLINEAKWMQAKGAILNENE